MKKSAVPKLLVAGLLVGGVGLYYAARGERDAPASAVYADGASDFVDNAAQAGDIVVDFDDDVDTAHVEALGRRLGIVLRPHTTLADGADPDRIYVGHVEPARERATLLALRRDPEVEAAEEDLMYGIPEGEQVPQRDEAAIARGAAFPNDPRYGEQWHMEQLHMPAAWAAAQGQGVIVAVIDTGVSRVQDLAQTEFVGGWNFVANSADAGDDHGHGTHVAGTIAQSTDNGVGVAGVAYRAKIMPLKVLSAQGSGSVAGIAEAIRWAADHGAKVINMSLGGRLSSQVLGKAVKYAHDKGVTVVCAAGNDGRGKVSFPAAFADAIAVAATQRDEQTTFYSNWGKEIDVAAPGGNTRGPEGQSGGVLQNTRFGGQDDYFFFMGTSMASPHVAGVAALIVSQGVGDPDAVEKILKATARPPAGEAKRANDFAQRYGAGLVDAAAAVKRAQLGTGATELGAAALLTGLVLGRLRRRGRLAVGLGGSGLVALVFGASGLFFLPQLGLGELSGMGLLAHGLPAWDGALLGAAGHGNLIFHSALLPIVAALLLFGFARARGLVAGLALGVGGHLFAQAALGSVNVQWMVLDPAWLVANGLIAAAIGWAALRK